MTAQHHRFVEAAIRALVEGRDGRPCVDPRRLPELRDLIAGSAGAPDLVEGVRSLMLFAVYVGDKEGSREAALALLDAAAIATPALEARAALSGEGQRKAHERASSFIGRTRSSSAPRLGAAAPDGTVALSSMIASLRSRRRG